MVCSSTGEATHYERRTGSPGVPDVTLTSKNLEDRVTWTVLNYFGSDHLPIISKSRTVKLAHTGQILRNADNGGNIL